MHSILVKDYMNNQPKTVKGTTNVRDAVELMLSESLIGLCVIDDSNNLIGYVSEQDCVQEMLNDAFYCEEPAAVNVVMSTDVITVSPDNTIVELAQMIINNTPKNYPVISNKKLVGLISRTEVLQSLVDNDDDCYIRKSG